MSVFHEVEGLLDEHSSSFLSDLHHSLLSVNGKTFENWLQELEGQKGLVHIQDYENCQAKSHPDSLDSQHNRDDNAQNKQE